MRRFQFSRWLGSLAAAGGMLWVWHAGDAAASALIGETFTSARVDITRLINDGQYLWAGTGSEGLLRIKKSSGETIRFTASNSGLGGNCITGLAKDSLGAVLVAASQGGIVRFDGTRWEELPGFAYGDVRGIAVDGRGTVWAHSLNSGIAYLEQGAWKTVIGRFSGILTANPRGDIWLCSRSSSGSSACSEGFIYEYADKALQSTLSLSSVCPEIAYPWTFVADNKKNCWIGAAEKLIRINGQSSDSFTVSQDTASSTYCSVLAAGANDVILISTMTYGSGVTRIYVYDQVNAQGGPLDSAVLTYSGLSVGAACDDNEGCFWLAASNGSIIKIDRSKRATTLAAGNSVLPGNSVASLVIDKSNRVWAATNNGIAGFDNSAWTVYPGSGDTFPGWDASALALDSSGTVWAGFRQPLESSMVRCGLSSFNGQHWRQLSRTHISVKMIAFDKAGVRWTVSDEGVARFNGTAEESVFTRVYSSDRDIALGTTVNTVAFDSLNTPWIGTGLGVKKYVNGAWIADSALIRLISAAAGPTGRNVTALVFDGAGIRWAGTGSGLIGRVNGTYAFFDTTGGVLPDPAVQCITVDAPNSAWIGTKRGLVHFTGENHITYTTANSGLLDNDIASVAVARTGDVWIGTRAGGLTLFRQPGTPALFNGDATAKRPVQPVDISPVPLNRCSSRITVTTDGSYEIRLSLISLEGKLIKRFPPALSHKKAVAFVWDGTDEFNRPVSRGVYVGIVTGNGKIIGRKIVPRP